MLFKSIAVVLFTASFATAEPQPYRAQKLGMMSVNMGPFGLVRRQDPGYKPEFKPCGEGSTCEESCGAGKQQCASSNAQLSCYTPAAQNCCPNNSGHACDFGYYCTVDASSETYCCPDGMDLVACAAKYSVSALANLGSSTSAPAGATTSAPVEASTSAPVESTTSAPAAVASPPSTSTTSASAYGTAYATASSTYNITAYNATPSIITFPGAASHQNAYGLVTALALGLMVFYATL